MRIAIPFRILQVERFVEEHAEVGLFVRELSHLAQRILHFYNPQTHFATGNKQFRARPKLSYALPDQKLYPCPVFHVLVVSWAPTWQYGIVIHPWAPRCRHPAPSAPGGCMTTV